MAAQLFRTIGAALAVLAFGAVLAWPHSSAHAATGGYKAMAFAALPRPAMITVQLYDDSPDNSELAKMLEDELAALGLRKPGTPPLTLTLDVRRLAAVEEEGEPDGNRRAMILGLIQLQLRDPAGEVVWAAEAAVEAVEGDLVGEARQVIPVIADTIGQTIEIDTIDLYSK